MVNTEWNISVVGSTAVADAASLLNVDGVITEHADAVAKKAAVADYAV
jgi:hypothetical protein